MTFPSDLNDRRKMIRYMLEQLTNEDYENCTQWEQDFLDSINEQFYHNDNLSDRQCEILEKIYDRHN